MLGLLDVVAGQVAVLSVGLVVKAGDVLALRIDTMEHRKETAASRTEANVGFDRVERRLGRESASLAAPVPDVL